ncbi:hypothetical protein BDV27DRAFT_155807 [Aspergillus caelatus]|uniref:GS catalytic domain-containing protein n=1 Tax=Aspergillus caelatus TaxID=61420 RepID=A0A5N7A9N4_9EURO|nr:uncharacterized protein BDV27DRAFT_155807 [Aspergillus caelatus]KAE8366532.1 hypothetical protein BDV27DRAFT_155807 [Aspergillus caelatus]
MSLPDVTAANVAEVLQNDRMVKVAGVDVDGQLRGKLMKKSKFLSIVAGGFGFCSITFGWDQQDMDYPKELAIWNEENGYRDLNSFRRIPWENNVPFFLVSFLDPDTREPVCACPRGLLKNVAAKAETAGYRAMAGGIAVWIQGFKCRISTSQAHYVMFVSTIRYVVKASGIKHGIAPCFMAKPRHGFPGNSGHMHITLVTMDGKNAFTRDTPDPSPPHPDVAHLSDLGRQFLAGLLTGLPDMMPLFAPTINSYKPTHFEIRVPGADANPHFVLAAIIALGWRGIEKELEIPVPPLPKGEDMSSASDKGVRLAKSLNEAVATFTRPDNVAREVFGDSFVDHFGGTREHEIQLWEEAVTDWEVRRYIETV